MNTPISLLRIGEPLEVAQDAAGGEYSETRVRIKRGPKGKGGEDGLCPCMLCERKLEMLSSDQNWLIFSTTNLPVRLLSLIYEHYTLLTTS